MYDICDDLEGWDGASQVALAVKNLPPVTWEAFHSLIPKLGSPSGGGYGNPLQ